MKKRNLMPSLVLGAICLAVALLLSVINVLTAPVIEAAREEAAQAALREVLPEGKDFIKFDVSEGYPEAVTEGYKADEGYVFKMVVTGWKPGLTIMCGINNDGIITGANYIESNETLSAEVGLGEKFVGFDINTINPDIVAGPTPTMTTSAYYNAIASALEAYAIAANKMIFTKWCKTEIIPDVDGIYISDGYEGCMVVIGDNRIYINGNGEIEGNGVSDSDSEKALAAYGIWKSSTLEKVDIPANAHEYVVEIHKTASGNYKFKMNAFGSDKNNAGSQWSNDQFIVFEVSISADGEIIDCLTLIQKESPGYGDKCQTDAYYDEWIGVRAEDITVSEIGNPQGPGVIAGSTYTTRGYQEAMKYAFEAFELLKGGNA